MNDTKRKKVEFFNKKARFDYEILETLEVGISLTGDEIKAIRAGRVNMTSSYAKVISGEIFWIGATFNLPDDTQRTRKLLLHKEQIRRLVGKSQEQGMALLPLKLYLTRGKAKIELGVGKGLKKFDKRENLKKKDQEREIGRKMKNY
ncbi:MAG: SsrA-binding protein SmpB [Patescibacteria group bacterium]|jgi:SsrA-binding protein